VAGSDYRLHEVWLHPKRDSLVEIGRIAGSHEVNRIDPESIVQNVAVDLTYRTLIVSACAQVRMLYRESPAIVADAAQRVSKRICVLRTIGHGK
jgi:3-deoxy-D-arabino-heptulosonate 7-phosphate (DAHP) synthase class II